jgi:SAM-dependent methyltransferase
MIESYSAAFYESQKTGSRLSAERIVPILTDLLRPQSVIDVGCGIGAWLFVFKALGVSRVTGIDGDWAASHLEIKPSEFVSFDFASAPIPYSLDLPIRKYDLAICLEFLEHLQPNIAGELVNFLCSVSDVVIASAAIPNQGGVHHVNEQWPDYWAALFRERGYVPCDALRHVFWNIPDVEPCYAQNTILYFRDGVPSHVVEFAKRTFAGSMLEPHSLIHPSMMRLWTDLSSYPFKKLLAACYAKIQRRLAKPFSSNT